MIKNAFWLALCALALLLCSPLRATQINTFDGLEIGADDGSFKLRLRARLQLDADFYQSDKQRLASGGFVRRARIGVVGNLHEWEYSVSYDNSKAPNPLVNAKVSRVVGPGRIWIGQFKIFEGLDEMSRDSETLFIERSYLGEVMPGHRVGVAYNGAATDMFGYAASLYNRRDSGDATQQPDNVGYGMVARGYFLPVDHKDLVIHLGASQALEKTQINGASSQVNVIGRDDKYINNDDFHFVVYDRKSDKAEVKRTVLEGLSINGPLLVQAEYLNGRVTTDITPDDRFYAWYAMAGYLVTGESHLYDTKKGRPERVRPQRASGAVEIAARVQRIARRSVDNAELSATEFGINYYANENVRFMINYSLVDNKLTDDKPRLLSLRTQIDF